MAIMLAETYQAFKAVGAPEEEVIAAAEELAAYENRLASIDNRLAMLEGRLAAIETRVTARKRAHSVPRRGQCPVLGRRRSVHDADLGGWYQCRGDDRDFGVLLKGHGP